MCRTSRPQHGHGHGELTTQAEARAGRLHCAAVLFHEITHQREAYAPARFGARRRGVRLRVQVEDPKQHCSFDADARVTNAQARMGNLAIQGDDDRPSVRRVFRCIDQEIGKGLLEPRGVDMRLLRYYDELGLLRPTHTDPNNGYRYYGAEIGRAHV